MSKDNRNLPSAIKRDIQLLDSVSGRREYKRPNAQKYGVYATPVIIPGEDASEFHALLAELLDWWKPSGPSLRHAVHRLAESMWRLRRVEKAVQTELCQNTFDPQHPAFQEEWGYIICFIPACAPNRKSVLRSMQKSICGPIKSTT